MRRARRLRAVRTRLREASGVAENRRIRERVESLEAALDEEVELGAALSVLVDDVGERVVALAEDALHRSEQV